MALSQPLVSAAPTEHRPGFKFQPSDEEIVLQYLRPRAANDRLPSADITDVNILMHNPWELLPEGTLEKYFFFRRVLRWTHGNQWNRASGDGHWKTSGNDQPIFSSTVSGGVPLLIGFKKTLVFYHGKAGVGQNTEYAMQEYSLAGSGLTPYCMMSHSSSNNNGEGSSSSAVITKKNDNPCKALNGVKVPVMVPDQTWVVCCIYKKRKHTPRVIAKVYSNAEGGHVPYYNFFEQGISKGTARSGSRTNMKDNTSKAGK